MDQIDDTSLLQAGPLNLTPRTLTSFAAGTALDPLTFLTAGLGKGLQAIPKVARMARPAMVASEAAQSGLGGLGGAALVGRDGESGEWDLGKAAGGFGAGVAASQVPGLAMKGVRSGPAQAFLKNESGELNLEGPRQKFKRGSPEDIAQQAEYKAKYLASKNQASTPPPPETPTPVAPPPAAPLGELAKAKAEGRLPNRGFMTRAEVDEYNRMPREDIEALRQAVGNPPADGGPPRPIDITEGVPDEDLAAFGQASRPSRFSEADYNVDPSEPIEFNDPDRLHDLRGDKTFANEDLESQYQSERTGDPDDFLTPEQLEREATTDLWEGEPPDSYLAEVPDEDMAAMADQMARRTSKDMRGAIQRATQAEYGIGGDAEITPIGGSTPWGPDVDPTLPTPRTPGYRENLYENAPRDETSARLAEGRRVRERPAREHGESPITEAQRDLAARYYEAGYAPKVPVEVGGPEGPVLPPGYEPPDPGDIRIQKPGEAFSDTSQ